MDEEDYLNLLKIMEESYIKNTEKLSSENLFLVIDSLFEMLPKKLNEINHKKIIHFIQFMFNTISLITMKKETMEESSSKKFMGYYTSIVDLISKHSKEIDICSELLREIFRIYNFSSTIFKQMIASMEEFILKNPTNLFIPLMRSSQNVLEITFFIF
jgi:hypothetical protein